MKEKSDGFYKSAYNIIYRVYNDNVYIYSSNQWVRNMSWVPNDFTKKFTVFIPISEEELFLEML